MCGIAGYFLRTPSTGTYQHINVLLNSIRHRGPNDEGICLISRKNNLAKFYKTDRTLSTIGSSLSHINDPLPLIRHDVALIHTRYAIIDLTDGGHQPFPSADNSIIAIFNGEIYNYLELKAELSTLDVLFRTASDTEVLVEGYRIWKDALWSKLNGFWAVAMYHFNDNTIVLSRDRLGVAPLYYRHMQDGFYFSSSIQSLLNVHPDDVTLDVNIIRGFVETSLKDFDNSTCYSEIKSIPPGSVVAFKYGDYNINSATVNKYWNIPKSRLNIGDLSFDEAVLRFRETFFNAVDIRLRADLPVAFELSGGLDSSSVVAVASILRRNDIRTYTIKVPKQNEEPYARSILEKYPIDYRVLTDPEETFLVDMEEFSSIMEEPYHSPNIYTHYKMRKIMKSEGVAVVIAGAGGDEVLCGYEHQLWPKAYIDLKRKGKLWHAIYYELSRAYRNPRTRKKIMKDILRREKRRLYNRLRKVRFTRHCENENLADLVKGDYVLAGSTEAERYARIYEELAFHEQSTYHFNVGMLPYYLRSNDNFTMAIPLEHRFPFLDYRLVEMGLQMPVPYLFKDGWTKYVLRKAMEPYLPEKILWRTDKMGFPFAKRRFLSNHRSRFEQILTTLIDSGMSKYGCEDYESLLEKDPTQLWRMISTALWLNSRSSK
jgi:asparagine synthase (glutamine-hydrolysing)